MSLDDLVDRHFGRHFFELDRYQLMKKRSKQGHPCRIVELSIPDDHSVTRVLHDGVLEHRAEIMNSNRNEGGISYPPVGDGSLVRCSSEEETNSYITSRNSSINSYSVLSNAVSSLDNSSGTTPTIASGNSKGSTLSTKVRDLHPFSRNGVGSHLRMKQPKYRSSEKYQEPPTGFKGPIDQQSSNSKPEVPWKTLRYLGYKPSMRKYLKESYTPSIRDNLKTPFIIGVSQNTSENSNIDNKEERKNNSVPQNYARSLCNQNSAATKLMSRFRQHQQADKAISINRFIGFSQGNKEKPKLGILSKCQTVVKPQVSMKGLILT